MATPYKVDITTENTGLLKVKQTEEAAHKASELLQRDLAEHHIPHHILALFGTGAPASALQNAYDSNTSYQRRILPTHDSVVSDLITSWDHAQPYLGKESHYPDFLAFFQRELSLRPPSSVLTTYLLSGTPSADDMLTRLFSGFLHPLIQLMYGLEWDQPAIIATGLAQTAVHSPSAIKSFLLSAEESPSTNSPNPPPLHILSLLSSLSSTPLSTSAHFTDSNKIRDGVLARAYPQMVSLASQVHIPPIPSAIAEHTAQMFHTSLLTACLSALTFAPPKLPKFDFFLIHHVNSAPIFATINKQEWITDETKAMLLGWKVRMDLLQGAARRVGRLEEGLEKLRGYRGRKVKEGQKGEEVIRRLWGFEDDGHAVKLGRAALVCREMCRGFEDREWLVIKGDMWDKVFHLIVDSVEAPGPNWVRSCGFEEAWKDVPDDTNARL